MKKRITLQRVDTPKGIEKAFTEIENVINRLKISESGDIVSGGDHPPFDPQTMVGPKGDQGPQGVPGAPGAPGIPGPPGLAIANLDGGHADSVYGGVSPIDCGGA